MKIRALTMLVFAAAALAFAAAGFADRGGGRKAVFGPYTLTSTNNGSCSNRGGKGDVPWARNMITRVWRVKPKGDGTFRVTQENRGTFVTLAAPSPGKCGNRGGRHGSVIKAGIGGRLEGTMTGTVVSASYMPDGCSAAAADCSTRSGFIAAVFGSGARFTCDLGYAGCSFVFVYTSADRRLKFRRWEDRGTDGAHEYFIGDVATA
jgi:hypothetical protein